MSRASLSSGRSATGEQWATRSALMPPSSRRANATPDGPAARRQSSPARRDPQLDEPDSMSAQPFTDVDAGAPAPDMSIDLRRELETSGVAGVLEELDRDLIGLAPVKKRIRETAALLLVDRARQKLGLSQETPTLH